MSDVPVGIFSIAALVLLTGAVETGKQGVSPDSVGIILAGLVLLLVSVYLLRRHGSDRPRSRERHEVTAPER